MKKTFTANIAGTVFHIEEDAYDQLLRYLSGIRSNFSGSSGADEIMADIEARIAELFNERLQGREVVTLADVQHVEAVMGRPEDFGDGTTQDGPTTGGSAAQAGQRVHRRLMRDPDDKWVGGVLSGLAAYIGTEVIWLRIAFIVLLYVGYGSPVFFYLLLWVLVPMASTAADKLAMRGEPVTVDNIKRVFDEGTERMKAGAERVASEARDLGRDMGPRAQEFSKRAASGVEGFVHALLTVFGKLLGLFLVLLGALLLFLLVALAFGTSTFGWDFGNIGRATVHEFLNAWFFSFPMAKWAWVHVVIALAIPVLGLMLGGLKLLFQVHIPRWFGWVFGVLWLWAVGVCVVLGIRQASEFRSNERLVDNMVLQQPAGHILYLDAARDSIFNEAGFRYSDDLDLIDLSGGEIRFGSCEVDVRQSEDTLFHLELVRTSMGAGKKEAGRNARNVRAFYEQNDSLLRFSPVYSAPLSDKLRGQGARFVVRVPVGGSVHFDRSSGRVINDIDNVTNTLDKDMLGRTWTMTPQGLDAGQPQRSAPRRVVEQRNEAPQGHASVNDPVQSVLLPDVFTFFSRTVSI